MDIFEMDLEDEMWRVLEDFLDELPRDEDGYKMLLNFLRKAKIKSLYGLQSAFAHYNKYMSEDERKELLAMVKKICGGNPELIRICFGHVYLGSDSGYDKEEREWIDRLDATNKVDMEMLCIYLERNVNCAYGWKVLFEKYANLDSKRCEEMEKWLNSFDTIKRRFSEISRMMGPD